MRSADKSGHNTCIFDKVSVDFYHVPCTPIQILATLYIVVSHISGTYILGDVDVACKTHKAQSRFYMAAINQIITTSP